MLFFTALHKIKGAPNETRRQLAERTERTLVERELQMMDIKKVEVFKDENFQLLN
jgi:hypothetical protein